MIRFIFAWAVTLVVVSGLGTEATPTSKAARVAFYTLVRRGDSVEIASYQRNEDLEFRRDPNGLTIDLQALKLTDLTPSTLKVSPKGRWLAVSLGSSDWERALIVLDLRSKQIVFVMRESEQEGIWFDWKDENRLHFLREVDTPEGMPEKFHVYSIHGSQWKGTEKRITRNPTQTPGFLLDGYRARERRAIHADKVLLPLGYRPPFSRPAPGNEGFPATPWIPHLMDPDGHWGSVSPSEREMALVVGRESGENAVILLRKRKDQWWESTILSVNPNEHVWRSRFWGEYVVVGVENWKLTKKPYRPATIEYSNKRLLLFSLRSGRVLCEMEAEAFAPAPGPRHSMKAPLRDLPVLPGERLVKARPGTGEF